LEELFNKVSDGVIFSFDGKSFDAHQHDVLLEEIDNVILREIVPDLMIKKGYSVEQIKTVLEYMTDMEVDVSGYYPGFNSKILFKGKIYAGTFTGHCSRTTWGNTMRSYIY